MSEVDLFVTCLADQLYPGIGAATARVLEGAGCAVAFPAGQTCCGQVAFNGGYRDEARAMARRFLDAFEGNSPVVAPSGSCAEMVRKWYPVLFRDDPLLLARARSLAARTFELSEFLVRVLRKTDLGAVFDCTATYHSSCRGLRGLGLLEEPLELLRSVRGLRLVDLRGYDECCGFGGLFSVKFSALSGAMLASKLDAIESSGAEIVVGTDASCLMHIAGGLARRGSKVRTMHLAEVLSRE